MDGPRTGVTCAGMRGGPAGRGGLSGGRPATARCAGRGTGAAPLDMSPGCSAAQRGLSGNCGSNRVAACGDGGDGGRGRGGGRPPPAPAGHN